MSSSPGISLIAGLGNPGSEYADTRHNAGFHFLELLLEGRGQAFKSEGRFSGRAAKLGIGDRTEIEWFVGPHTINGKGTYDFLHKHLDWPKR